MEKSERRAVTGARINPSQKTGEDMSMCDMPAMLAAIGKLGQKWLQKNKKVNAKCYAHKNVESPVKRQKEEPGQHGTSDGQ